MTTSFSSNWKTARGSWSKMFVSKTKCLSIDWISGSNVLPGDDAAGSSGLNEIPAAGASLHRPADLGALVGGTSRHLVAKCINMTNPCPRDVVCNVVSAQHF